MSVTEIQKQSGLKLEVAESLYYHCIWLREAKPTDTIIWRKLLCDKNYRLNRNHK